ncbi:MAG: hypothetical protein JNL17_16665 [Cyclobacteriaceae bacterium]|nr:hypothetical protein [Cyclobacteriaceae bacterium]
MKELILTSILFTLTLLVFGQDSSDSSNATFEENSKWLTILKDTEKNQQLTIIQNKFFRQSTKANNEYMPLIIVDGVPINPNDNKTRDFVLNSLTADNVDIYVSDKEPVGLYTNKRFTGIISITITDKRIRKKFKRRD